MIPPESDECGVRGAVEVGHGGGRAQIPKLYYIEGIVWGERGNLRKVLSEGGWKSPEGSSVPGSAPGPGHSAVKQDGGLLALAPQAQRGVWSKSR